MAILTTMIPNIATKPFPSLSNSLIHDLHYKKCVNYAYNPPLDFNTTEIESPNSGCLWQPSLRTFYLAAERPCVAWFDDARNYVVTI